MVGLCPLEAAAGKTAVLLQSEWLGGGEVWHFPVPSGNLDSIFFLIYVFIFGCLQKEVQSHLVTA